MDEILKLNKVSLTYQSDVAETQAIKDLSFSVNKSEFVSIIGPSGCGKTTVLSLIAGLLKPTDGSILYKGENISKTTENIGYMLQRDELFPWRNIEKNVLLPLEIKKINTKDNRDNAHLLIEKYGLKDFLKSYPNMLSGGMRQRVALIRTLVSKPDLLLLDEPFSALDSQTRLKVNGDVYSIIRSENKTALLVTHDISEAISLSDKIIVLSKRPATVFKEHYLDFDKNLTPLKRREDKKFSKLFEMLWRELNDET